MAKTQHNKKNSQRTKALLRHQDAKRPFIAHLHELRKRLFYVAFSVVVFGGIAYGFEHQLIAYLLRPAAGQQFIYTSPGGGVDFLFRLCTYIGLACSIPVIVYQVLKYVEPLLQKASTRFIKLVSFTSGVLAVIGMVFGYYIGLPNALHFLLHQFTTQQIKPLVTIQSYMAFVSVYLLGSALLLQAPLIMLFINRIKPTKPSRFLRYERWVILVAFIGAGLMNPTPNIFAQLLVAGPLIIMYQVGIALVWIVNRTPKGRKIAQKLLPLDEAVRNERLQKAQNLTPFKLEPIPALVVDTPPEEPINVDKPQQAVRKVDPFMRPNNRTVRRRPIAAERRAPIKIDIREVEPPQLSDSAAPEAA